MKNLLLLMVTATLSLLLGSITSAQVTQEWLARYSEGPGSTDIAVDLAIDESGYLYVTGSGGNHSHFATLKYDGYGTMLWSALDSSGGASFHATALALDPNGNVLVSGHIWVYPGDNNYDYAVVKYNSAGVQQWASTASHGLYDYSVDMAVDADGNVYVTGFSGGDYIPWDYFTVKFNSAGAQQWAATYNGTANYEDRATAIAVDEEGNVYVTGYSPGSGTSVDFVTIKYNTNGVEEWVARYDSPGSGIDQAGALALDCEGNVYVAGGNWDSPSGDFTTLKYDNDGNQLWAAFFNDSTAQGGMIDAITLDVEGNIVIAGGIGNESVGLMDCLTLKYNPEGVQQWVAQYDGPAHYNDFADAVKTDPCGNVYVTGGSEQIYPLRGWYPINDYITIKYNDQGQQEWLMRYDGPGHGNDLSRALALDQNGNVYVTGYSGSDYVTIKYHQTAPNLTISLVPFTFPIQIPASGGSFDFYVFADNSGPGNQTVDLWSKVMLPGGSVISPVLGPVSVSLDSGTTGWIRHQNVPGRAPAGLYTYVAYAGDYPNSIWASDSLQFTKLESGEGISEIGDWSNTGNDFQQTNAEFITHHSSLITSIRPNPFNPTTILSFELRAASFVSLIVYDTTGRLVATLADGWREAGTQEVTFDGAGLSSGIYLYRVTAGTWSETGKMILLK